MMVSKKEVWDKFKGLTMADREWLIDKVMMTYCINCADVLGPDGECPNTCDEDGDDDDDEDGELDPEAEEDENEEDAGEEPDEEGDET